MTTTSPRKGVAEPLGDTTPLVNNDECAREGGGG